MKKRIWVVAPMVVIAALVLAACGSSGSSTSEGGAETTAGSSGGGGEGSSGGEPIKIGATLPLTGPLSGPFGPQLEAGYQYAIEKANGEGGLEVEGEKHEVELILQDNKSEPTIATQQARSLVISEGAVALLGAATPPLSIPISTVADALKVPLVNSITPIKAWLSGNEAGWQYAWDVFFDETQQTEMQFLAADLAKTNKKIALFTDTEQDGVTMGKLWEEKAPGMGYEIVYHATFPPETADFTSFVEKAKASGAEVVFTQMIPPDGIALWKQMKALHYTPQFAGCEKCADGAFWQEALGPLAEGTSATGWWSPALERPDTPEMVKAFEGKFGDTQDMATAVAGDTIAQILMEAIEKADSTEPEKINEAIAETNGEYPFAEVKFNSEHYSAVPAIETQWQGKAMKLVAPKGPNSSPLVAPPPGLK